MDNNKLDRLFREHLDQAEYTPKAESWDAVKGQISQSSKGGLSIYMKVAAAVVFVLTATWVIIQTQPQSGNVLLISNINHPIPASTYQWEWPEIEMETRLDLTHPVIDTTPKTMMASRQTEEEVMKRTEIPLFDLSAINNIELAVAMERPTLQLAPKAPAPESPNIKITYIATQPSDTTKTNMFSELISLAKETQPMDLLADLRDAKNNLFNKN